MKITKPIKVAIFLSCFMMMKTSSVLAENVSNKQYNQPSNVTGGNQNKETPYEQADLYQRELDKLVGQLDASDPAVQQYKSLVSLNNYKEEEKPKEEKSTPPEEEKPVVTPDNPPTAEETKKDLEEDEPENEKEESLHIPIKTYFSSQSGTERLEDPLHYNVVRSGFLYNQDVVLVRGFPYSQLWLKNKSWIHSAALFVRVNGEEYPLKSFSNIQEQEDNALVIDGRLGRDTDHFLATSSIITLNNKNKALRIYLPTLVTYGGNPYVNFDLLSSFQEVFIKVFNHIHGFGKSVTIPYYLRDKMGGHEDPSLKKLALLQRDNYEMIVYEYRGYSLNLKGIRLADNEKMFFSLFTSDLIKGASAPIESNSVKLLQWLYDAKTYQTVLRFAVVLNRNQTTRHISAEVMGINPENNAKDVYDVQGWE